MEGPLDEEMEPGIGEEAADPETPAPQSEWWLAQRDWRPKASRGGWICIAAAALGFVCFVGALVYLQGRPMAIDLFVAVVLGLAGLALAIVGGVLWYGFSTMRYRLDTRRLTLRWLWIRESIPLGAIQGVYAGHRLGKSASVEGLALPGYLVGRARAEGLGWLVFYGTSSDPSDAMIVATMQRSYAITPAQMEQFRGQLIELLEALPPEEVELAPDPKRSMPALLGLSILRDGMALAIQAVALLVLLASFGYVSFRFPDLPALMPLHFNDVGVPNLIGPPQDAFRMPLIGLLILLANTAVAAALHQWRMDAGRLLAGATVIVQLAMLMAVVQVVH